MGGVRGGSPQTGRRRYDASRRRAAAQERRARVAGAAAALFAERGWSATTIAAVAAAADVSPELVATAFGGKPGLFRAALRQSGVGDREEVLRRLTALGRDGELDREERLDRIVDLAVEVLTRTAPLVPVMQIGADHDEELQRLLVERHEIHVRVSQEVARLAAAGPVAEDVVDEVVLLTRAETYLLLVRERGWSGEQYAAWLRRGLDRLFGPVAGDAMGQPSS